MNLKELNWKTKTSQRPKGFILDSKTPKLMWTKLNLRQKVTEKISFIENRILSVELPPSWENMVEMLFLNLDLN